MFNLFEEILFHANYLSKNDKRKIYRVIMEAINFTRNYISRNETRRVNDGSQILSYIWLDAMGQLQQMNQPKLNNIINILNDKSDFWSDPSRYNDEMLDQKNMRLERLTHILNDLVK
jgi:hypothetical protein